MGITPAKPQIFLVISRIAAPAPKSSHGHPEGTQG